jgi:hypothetical protein
MKISFFEEFADETNLAKLKYVTWPTKLYIAAPSLKRFLEVKEEIKTNYKKNKITEFIYWPTFEIREGYWVSPFTKRDALLRLEKELKSEIGKKTSVMLDYEFPWTKNPLLFVKQSINFFKNKKLINGIVKTHPSNVYSAEYHAFGKRKEKVMEWIGLHFPNKKYRTIKMLYHSKMLISNHFFAEELVKVKEEKSLVGLGTIAKGIWGFDHILEPKKLRSDLKAAKKAKIKEVVIFRLGGMNAKYAAVVKKFV